MEIFLYDYWEMRREVRVYDRLSRVDVRIIYTESDPALRGSGAASGNAEREEEQAAA
jgi:hypothetical protein